MDTYFRTPRSVEKKKCKSINNISRHLPSPAAAFSLASDYRRLDIQILLGIPVSIMEAALGATQNAFSNKYDFVETPLSVIGSKANFAVTFRRLQAKEVSFRAIRVFLSLCFGLVFGY